MDNTSTRKKTFEAVFRRYYQPVQRFVGALTCDECAAQDIVQEVMTALWLKPELWAEAASADNDARLRNTIYKMAKHTTLNHLRHKLIVTRYEQEATRDAYDELTTDELAVEPIYYQEAVLLLRLKIEQFPPRRREIFKMSRFDYMTNAEIAERLGISVRTVETQIHYCLTELRGALAALALLIAQLFAS